MKIILNTSQPHAACSSFYMNAFRTIEGMSYNNLDYKSCDIALFMTYDHEHIENVRKAHPHLKIGIIDPRSYRVAPSVAHCDFVIIDSIEMEDYWRCAKKPIFRYAEYPDIPYVEKNYEEKDKIVIGYHGNTVHLDCMSESVTPALSSLGKKYNIQLLAMYNGTPPDRRNSKWCPENVEIRHVPWSMGGYLDELANIDIGIVPNNLIYSKESKNNVLTGGMFNYSDDDYLLRFKMPSNPGRFIIFGKLGIPVVADFYPSALQYITKDRGFVACNEHGWEHCLEQLIISSKLRETMGKNLQNLVRNEFDFEVQNKKIVSFFRKILRG